MIDASVALSWVLPSDDTNQALSLRNQALDNPEVVLMVPPIFWDEVANVLWVAVRRKRMGRQDAIKALDLLVSFEFMVWSADPKNCLELSIAHELSAYDTAYLDLAMDQQATLWTMDLSLKKVAESLDVTVLP